MLTSSVSWYGLFYWDLFLRKAKESTKEVIEDLSDAISQIVGWVIQFAPLGVMGLIFTAVSENGVTVFRDYGKIIALLVAVMLIDALIINPIIVFTQVRENPYPLVLRCLKDSGITAFFTRSSAANIPVNMQLIEIGRASCRERV